MSFYDSLIFFHFPPYVKLLNNGKIIGVIELMSFNIFPFPPYTKLLNNGKIIGILYLSWIFNKILLNYGHLMAV